jgi:hypothetical protein
MLYAGEEREIVGAVIAPPAATFQRLDLVKAGFPKAQHVLGQIQLLGRF